MKLLNNYCLLGDVSTDLLREYFVASRCPELLEPHEVGFKELNYQAILRLHQNPYFVIKFIMIIKQTWTLAHQDLN